MSLSGLPFDDIRDLVANLAKVDESAASHARQREAAISDQWGSTGRQADLCQWLAGWSGKSAMIARPMIALFAGTNKASEQLSGVDDTWRESTLASVTRMAAGGAPVNQVCASHDIGLKVFDLALQFPVGDITVEDALDEKSCAATIGFGMEAIAGGVDLLGLAAFGKGSEIANAAMLSLLLETNCSDLFGQFPSDVASQMDTLAKRAAEYHAEMACNSLELLRRLGGREHAALAGAILAARVNHVPVVLDGMSAIAVALVLKRLNSESLDHCIFASANKGNSAAYDAFAETGCRFVLEDVGNSFDGAGLGHAIGVLKSMAAVHSGTQLEE